MSVVLLLAMGAHGQAYEAQPCKATATLADELAAGQVETVAPVGPWFRAVAASSLLPPPESAKPDEAAARKLAEVERVELGSIGLPAVAADVLSCRYGPTNLLDDDPATAWCEGVEGPGVDQVVIVELDDLSSLRVRNGYQKSDARFAENGRVRKVEVAVLGQGWYPPVQGRLWADLPVLGRHEVELKDTDGWQSVPLPKTGPPSEWKPDNPEWAGDPSQQKPSFVALRILTTYAGSKWKDTCLSDIAP